MTTHHHENFFKKYLFSTDHKIIAMQYMITGAFMGLIGAYFAYVFRMQIAYPGMNVPFFGHVSESVYNTLVTNHGAIMIFWFAMPVLIAAFGNFLIPLMIGCDDMAFPRINRLSYQIFFISVLVLFSSFLMDGGGFGGGWTAYPPLSAKAEYSLTPMGAPLWLMAVALEFVAFLLGGINFITTLMNARAKGMKMFDIPMVIWMIIIASILFMASVGPLIAGAIMLLFDQLLNTSFYDATKGGDPLLWQHLFWFFGHPEVYVVLLPPMGIAVEVMTTFSRKKLFGYKTFLYSVFLVGILSFVVWAHHMFVAGIDPRMAHFYTVTTMAISVPIAEICFLMMATLYGGSIELNTPMLFALAFLGEFIIGGVTGIYLGATATDIYFHDTYFVVAHFHYTFVPIAIIGFFAGLYYWFPKMSGKMMDDRLGKIHFWGTVIPFNCIFLTLFWIGMYGEHRRIFDYRNFPYLNTEHLFNLRSFATISLVVMLLAQFVFFYNLIKSLWKGDKAEANPWKANTLEWVAASPPPHGNFAVMPEVYRGPYEYGVPGRSKDYWPQNEK
ncbi:MAG: cbb3-type cytochrome c oxidase subunit I [Deltaproteobacteria bacterium]|nr:cbb3-type cytochrome c oxidase subunit I [Deltaproteobacteria bacterium]